MLITVNGKTKELQNTLTIGQYLEENSYVPSQIAVELNMEKIIFQSDDGTTAEFYVEEQTNIAGVTYLLVSDSQDEEADAYILKDISAPGSTEACYEMVEDDDELQAVYAVFQQMLDDVNFEWRSDF